MNPGVLVGNPKGNSYWEGLNVSWRIILKHIEKWNTIIGSGLIWLRIVTTDGLFRI
jgi:hypothetical protein